MVKRQWQAPGQGWYKDGARLAERRNLRHGHRWQHIRFDGPPRRRVPPLQFVNRGSGHYQPRTEHLDQMMTELGERGIEVNKVDIGGF